MAVLTDAFLAGVAEEYRVAAPSGRPAHIISANHGASVRTVHGWIGIARKRGFLEPGERGRVTGLPCPARCTALLASRDDITYRCELVDGHDADHRATIQWEDLPEGEWAPFAQRQPQAWTKAVA